MCQFVRLDRAAGNVPGAFLHETLPLSLASASRRDFPDVKWTSYREWAHAQDWKRILA